MPEFVTVEHPDVEGTAQMVNPRNGWKPVSKTALAAAEKDQAEARDKRDAKRERTRKAAVKATETAAPSPAKQDRPSAGQSTTTNKE